MDDRMTRRQIDDYLLYLREQEKSRATIEKYQRDIEKLYRFLGQEKPLDKQQLLDFKSRLTGHYLPSSVNSMLAAVNGFLLYTGRPELRLKRLKIQRTMFLPADKELGREEYIRLLRAARRQGNERLAMILQTIGATGIRVSELKFITVEAVKNRAAVVSCKNKSRVILIPEKLQQQLIVYADKHQIKTGVLFLTRGRRPVSRSQVWSEMKRLGGAAAVSAEKIFPHNLRHLFARSFYQKEKDITMLADLLGHSSIEVTRIYTKATRSEHAKQMDRLGLVIEST